MKHHQGYLLKELLVQANNAEEFEVMMNMGGLFMSADDGCYVGFLKPPDRQEMTDTEWKGSWFTIPFSKPPRYLGFLVASYAAARPTPTK